MQPSFEYLDQANVNRNYDWFSLNINLNFDKSIVDLEKILNNEAEFEINKDTIVFIHEYIHYLQNFNSPIGNAILCNFVIALNQIGASKVNENITLSLPIKLEKITDKTLWNRGIEGIDNIIIALGPEDDKIVFATPNKFENYEIVQAEHLKISNGRIEFELNNKTIREHMAHIGSLLFAGYNDIQIHEDYIARNEFCATAKMLEKQPSYWILFEYFYFHKYSNIAEGLIYLCNECLACSMPISNLEIFFKTITKPQFSSIKDLPKLVEMWAESTIMRERKKEFISKTLNLIDDLIKLCTKHQEHDFYKFNIVLFERLKANLSKYENFSEYFKNSNRLRVTDNWKKILLDYGTPIVRYRDKIPVITNQNESMRNTLTNILGVVKTVNSLKSTTTDRCPFHSDFDICKAGYKNNTDCLTNPVFVKNPENNGEECIYQNAIILMGLNDRIILPE